MFAYLDLLQLPSIIFKSAATYYRADLLVEMFVVVKSLVQGRVINPHIKCRYYIRFQTFYPFIFFQLWFYVNIVFNSFSDGEFCIFVKSRNNFSGSVLLLLDCPEPQIGYSVCSRLILIKRLSNKLFLAAWALQLINYFFASAIWIVVNFTSLLNHEINEWFVWLVLFANRLFLDFIWFAKFSGFYYRFLMDYFII